MINPDYQVRRESLNYSLTPFYSKRQGPKVDYNSTTFEPISLYTQKMANYSIVESKPDISKNVPIGDIHAIPERIKHGFKYKISNWYLRNISAIYKVEHNKGINISDSRARKTDICLAKYAQKVAEEMDVSSACYTGVKHALWASGILNDYIDMPKGSACNSLTYFNAHPERFEKLNISLKELKELPAGHIVVYTKEGLDGHIAITNGYGQEMSDCTDNMKWVERRKHGAEFHVYRLTDNWEYDPNLKKLVYKKE